MEGAALVAPLSFVEAAVTDQRIDAESYDRELPPRLKATLY